MKRALVFTVGSTAVLIALAVIGDWYIYAYSTSLCLVAVVLRIEWPGWM